MSASRTRRSSVCDVHAGDPGFAAIADVFLEVLKS
jgi:hypothetical protein